MDHRAIYTDNDLHDEVNRMCLADSRLFLPGLNLAYSDRASMAASVEVRVPFVDPVVAQAAFSIPGRDKIRNRQGKVALKQAAEAWLPEGDHHRPKASFSAPLRAWVRNDLREVINDVLVNGELVGAGMIRHAALDRLIEAERAGREDNAKQIWQLLTIELWHRNARSMGVGSLSRTKDTNEADCAELQVRGAHRPGRAGPGVPSGWRPGPVAVLAHLHRHRDDEGTRGQAVDGRQGAGPAGPGAKVLDTVAQQGPVATYKKVMNQLDSYTPLGYSLCGVVIEVGPGAEEFKVGQLVAAAGNEYALHAEYNWIPVNLCAAVPAWGGPRACRVRYRGRHRHAGRAPR